MHGSRHSVPKFSVKTTLLSCEQEHQFAVTIGHSVILMEKYDSDVVVMLMCSKLKMHMVVSFP
jgi:hypothetical protein